MAVQGGYAIDHERAIDGMVVDSQVNNSVSKVNNTDAVVPYGVAVARDGENGFVILDDDSVIADVVGVLRRELNKATRDGDADGGCRRGGRGTAGAPSAGRAGGPEGLCGIARVPRRLHGAGRARVRVWSSMVWRAWAEA